MNIFHIIKDNVNTNTDNNHVHCLDSIIILFGQSTLGVNIRHIRNKVYEFVQSALYMHPTVFFFFFFQISVVLRYVLCNRIFGYTGISLFTSRNGIRARIQFPLAVTSFANIYTLFRLIFILLSVLYCIRVPLLMTIYNNIRFTWLVVKIIQVVVRLLRNHLYRSIDEVLFSVLHSQCANRKSL